MSSRKTYVSNILGRKYYDNLSFHIIQKYENNKDHVTL